MNTTAAIPLIEREWDLETGFLGRLRGGAFDTDAYARLLTALELVEVAEGDTTSDRHFVALTWWIPRLIDRQLERRRAAGRETERVRETQRRLERALGTLLGVP